MQVAVTGATGAIGRRLLPVLAAAGHVPVAITRSAESARSRLPAGTDIREADTYSSASLRSVLAGADAIIHLAGESIFPKSPFQGRGPFGWKKRKRAIYESRILTTRALVQAIRELSPKPKVLVSGSAIGFYGARDPDVTVDENVVDADQFAAPDFLAWVCRDWENEAEAATRFGVRVVRVRTGVVLMRGDGALGQMEKPFRLGLGGPIGNGKQIVSWIHHEDLTGLFRFAVDQAELSGPVNGTAPNPVTNAEFSKALARALGKPCFFRVPKIALRAQLGPVARFVTTGQRVLPTRALEWGFDFRYATIEEAMAALYRPAVVPSPALGV